MLIEELATGPTKRSQRSNHLSVFVDRKYVVNLGWGLDYGSEQGRGVKWERGQEYTEHLPSTDRPRLDTTAVEADAADTVTVLIVAVGTVVLLC